MFSNLQSSTELVPEQGKIIDTADWSKSWKVVFDLKINTAPGGSDWHNIFQIKDLVSLYMNPWSGLDTHYAGGQFNFYEFLTVGTGTYHRVEISQFLYVDKVNYV